MLLPCWASGWARRPSRARRRRGAGRRRSHGRRRRRPRRRRGNRRRISGASRRRCTPSALCPGAGRLGRPVAVGGGLGALVPVLELRALRRLQRLAFVSEDGHGRLLQRHEGVVVRLQNR
eukprot:gene15-biopygen1496